MQLDEQAGLVFQLGHGVEIAQLARESGIHRLQLRLYRIPVFFLQSLSRDHALLQHVILVGGEKGRFHRCHSLPDGLRPLVVLLLDLLQLQLQALLRPVVGDGYQGNGQHNDDKGNDGVHQPMDDAGLFALLRRENIAANFVVLLLAGDDVANILAPFLANVLGPHIGVQHAVALDDDGGVAADGERTRVAVLQIEQLAAALVNQGNASLVKGIDHQRRLCLRQRAQIEHAIALVDTQLGGPVLRIAVDVTHGRLYLRERPCAFQ